MSTDCNFGVYFDSLGLGRDLYKMNLNGWCFRLAHVGRSVRFTVSREKKLCKFPKKVFKKLADNPQEKQCIDYKDNA